MRRVAPTAARRVFDPAGQQPAPAAARLFFDSASQQPAPEATHGARDRAASQAADSRRQASAILRAFSEISCSKP